jgi:ethanolamine utilization protein EutN
VILALVVGNVVATRKHEALHGSKMMLVLPVDQDGTVSGEEFMAADAVGAGPGERVLVVIEGRSACQAIRREQAPLDAAIVGIVDRIDLDTARP